MSDTLIWLAVFAAIWFAAWTAILIVLYRLGRRWLTVRGRW